jgi:hypothetical protein
MENSLRALQSEMRESRRPSANNRKSKDPNCRGSRQQSQPPLVLRRLRAHHYPALYLYPEHNVVRFSVLLKRTCSKRSKVSPSHNTR